MRAEGGKGRLANKDQRSCLGSRAGAAHDPRGDEAKGENDRDDEEAVAESHGVGLGVDDASEEMQRA